MRKGIWVISLNVWLVLLGINAFGQASEPIAPANPSGYLLLDKGLQYRITKSINSMYDFDFPTAERDFAVIM